MDNAQLQIRLGIMKQIRTATKLILQQSKVTDNQAISMPSLFSSWEEEKQYEVDYIVRWNGHLYRCIKNHISNLEFNPENSSTLWSRIDIASDGIDIWKQPTGKNDYYNIGDRCHYPDENGEMYESIIDKNILSPNVSSGWKVIE